MKKIEKKGEKKLTGLTIAMVLSDGFEEHEMTKPRAALKQAGAKVVLITLKGTHVTSWLHNKWGKTFAADMTIKQAKASHFDGVVLPGGVMNPDKLRTE